MYVNISLIGEFKTLLFSSEGDINCSDSVQITQESTIVGIITSIGLEEERPTCPKCYSTEKQD